ncbi:hypothetical protein OIU78_019326 [Salix suchowensis]|nr:hypothetical protein OIU78_019326 [Salix suchowensis]
MEFFHRRRSPSARLCSASYRTIFEKTSSPFRPSVIAIIASLCGVAAILFAVLFFRAVYMKGPRFEALEDWELDCPHRFRYQDLHTATKGFINSEIIGVGGFGAVYRGRLPTNGNDVAVKKISTPNSSQGLRGFTAEIESLGRFTAQELGYLAPELTRTGHASTSSDVYAFGILLLEVACGRKPIETCDFILTDFVVESHQMGKILDAADPKLNSAFVIKEMEVVLGLGLLCSHPNPKTRPTMREVIRYLNWEDKLPVIDDLGSSDSLSRSNRFMGAVSIEMITSSIDAGR